MAVGSIDVEAKDYEEIALYNCAVTITTKGLNTQYRMQVINVGLQSLNLYPLH